MANVYTSMKLTGRKQIFTSVTNLNSSNIIEVIKVAYAQHIQNSREIDFLFKYYKGDQPILQRIKKIRDDINNKVVENHAFEIVDFKKGYTFGEPVQYVQRGKCNLHDSNDEEGESDTKVSTLNELMFCEDKQSKDCELAEWFFVCGTAYRMTLPTKRGEENPFNTYVLDPRYTFVVYSNDFRKKPVLCVTYSKKDEDTLMLNIYTKKDYWLLFSDKTGSNFEIKQCLPNPLAMLPIVEYPANASRLGSFEIVVPLLDSMNNLASNRIDGVEQFIQSIMWFNNCDIDKDDLVQLAEMGGIKTKSEPGMPASVTILNQALDQSQVQTLVDYVYQTILTVAGVPDRRASSGGNTGQALIIGQGWAMAESSAKASELAFKCSEKEFLRLVLRILKDTRNVPVGLKDIALSDIDIKFTRNKTDNLLTKTQGLVNQLEAGIHPRIAISNVGLYSDPEQVYIDSKENMEKWKATKETQANNQTQTVNQPTQ